MVACFTDWMTDPEEGDHRSYLKTPSGTNTRIKHADTVHANLDQIVVISSRRGCPIHHLHLFLFVAVVTQKEFMGLIQGLVQRMMCRGPIDWPFIVPPKARTLTELLFLCFLCLKYTYYGHGPSHALTRWRSLQTILNLRQWAIEVVFLCGWQTQVMSSVCRYFMPCLVSSSEPIRQVN